MNATDTLSAQAPATTSTAEYKLAGHALKALSLRFPPRPAEDAWPATAEPAARVLERLEEPPLRIADDQLHRVRRRGAHHILGWLETFPGSTWQQRWNATPASQAPGADWGRHAREWTEMGPGRSRQQDLSSGLLSLICADVIRPSLGWLLTRTSANTTSLKTEVIPARDPEGFARLQTMIDTNTWTSAIGRQAQHALVKLLAAKGGTLADITVGDAIEYLTELKASRARERGNTLFYVWLRELGSLPTDAPGTLRYLAITSGQVSMEQLVDRFGLQCRPVRDLLVDYLKERQPALDYTSLNNLSRHLARNFWRDLEQHHPGIESLNLTPEVASAWKQRSHTWVEKRRQPDGSLRETVTTRANVASIMLSVRAFYLDIAQWAIDEPARWGPWAAPCPVNNADVAVVKHNKRRKARMDHRTRERLPALPIVVRAAAALHHDARARIKALKETSPGGSFTVLGETFIRAAKEGSTWAFRSTTGHRFDMALVESRTFWAWAMVEFLQHTGVRIEEMLETSHHSLIQYKLPTTGEIVPLLQIAPSKTDEERIILVSPELADVLSAIISRVRDPRTGAVPYVASYDEAEKTWNPQMPLLFQWRRSGEDSRLSAGFLRRALRDVLASTGLTDSAGQPLDFAPHDFRRIFITDAIRSGLPPHIAQVIAGHSNINTTMGYNAIYPAEAIEAHRAFIARRRALRPSEEYRTPTSEEWDAFLGHFERRKLSIGICARAFGTPCIHEHACIRCSMLRPDPAQRHRLVEIRDNLNARIAEAEREGWLGEIEGLQVSHSSAEEKITQLDEEEASRRRVIDLGMPTFSQIAPHFIAATYPRSC
ncbi:tyrosine-type recombinase/integrase [Streptomyces rochei]|uniref:tyrosine-type recombinase/integrase n=1 Tax=Streptomyces rochei TaxID=1928 RepID=UPI0033BAE9B4